MKNISKNEKWWREKWSNEEEEEVMKIVMS